MSAYLGTSRLAHRSDICNWQQYSLLVSHMLHGLEAFMASGWLAVDLPHVGSSPPPHCPTSTKPTPEQEGRLVVAQEQASSRYVRARMHGQTIEVLQQTGAISYAILLLWATAKSAQHPHLISSLSSTAVNPRLPVRSWVMRPGQCCLGQLARRDGRPPGSIRKASLPAKVAER